MARYNILCFLLIMSCQTTRPGITSNSKHMPSFATPFEKNNNYTPTYREIMDYYTRLGSTYDQIEVIEAGMTDSGFPLHEVIISADGETDPVKIKNSGKNILFINNGIHPGEPCGIDASMMLARDLVSSPKYHHFLETMVVVIIPVYNIGGHLNRSSTSRANQVGPEEYGFRGNAKNLDLNRDFVKCDSENARSFNRIFTKWDPDVFVDNHTSNGADYQYVLTLIATQKDKMEKPLKEVMTKKMLPFVYEKMKDYQYEMTPYVYARTIPEDGIMGFLDLPRYSTGYANLHQTIGFMPETHMLKPYKDRVWSTYYFSLTVMDFISQYGQELNRSRQKAKQIVKEKSVFDIQWDLDTDVVDSLIFKGFAAGNKPSKVTGMDRLFYDRSAPYTKKIPFYNTYKAKYRVKKPKAYIIPQAYKQIIDKMKANGVEVLRINKCEKKALEVYRIDDFKTVDTPYEGHYLHYDIKASSHTEDIDLYRGDYIIYTGQKTDRYIVETLEPEAPDSWFAWGFFDGILMQKEHFSSYVFEDIAERLLESDPSLKKEFEAKRRNDKEFRANAYEQLKYIYERSPYYEKTFRRYPVYRIFDDQKE